MRRSDVVGSAIPVLVSLCLLGCGGRSLGSETSEGGADSTESESATSDSGESTSGGIDSSGTDSTGTDSTGTESTGPSETESTSTVTTQSDSLDSAYYGDGDDGYHGGSYSDGYWEDSGYGDGDGETGTETGGGDGDGSGDGDGDGDGDGTGATGTTGDGDATGTTGDGDGAPAADAIPATQEGIELKFTPGVREQPNPPPLAAHSASFEEWSAESWNIRRSKRWKRKKKLQALRDEKFDGGIRRVGAMDTAQARHLLASMEESRWHEDTRRQDLPEDTHRHTHSLIVLYDSPVASVADDELLDALAVCLEDLCSSMEGFYGRYPQIERLLFARLGPGQSVPPHADSGSFLETRRRVHVPISGVEDSEFFAGGQWETLVAGEAYEINNQRQHGARNNGKGPRVHLIADLSFVTV